MDKNGNYDGPFRDDGSVIADLKVETKGARTHVSIDGKECKNICSLSLDFDPSGIPTATAELAFTRILTQGHTQVYFDQTQELAQVLQDVMPEITEYRAVDLAQKIMYRLATGNYEL